MNPHSSLDHTEIIRKFILTIQASSEIHALIINGPAGWGKSTAVDQALRLAQTQATYLGNYTTPLNFFNFLHKNSGKFIVIDDTFGLLNDANSMALLKAATWPQNGKRIVRWGSTSNKARIHEFVFNGKLAIICNSFPKSPDAEAVKSRSFLCRITISVARAKHLLYQAASEPKWFENSGIAQEVAKYLVENINESNLNQMSYRALKMGYELAIHNPDCWRELLFDLTGAENENPKVILREILKQSLPVKEQIWRFQEITGLKRRTFFNYRNEILEPRK